MNVRKTGNFTYVYFLLQMLLVLDKGCIKMTVFNLTLDCKISLNQMNGEWTPNISIHVPLYIYTDPIWSPNWVSTQTYWERATISMERFPPVQNNACTPCCVVWSTSAVTKEMFWQVRSKIKVISWPQLLLLSCDSDRKKVLICKT